MLRSHLLRSATFALIAATIVLAPPARAQQAVADLPHKSPVSAAAMSLVIAGSGQVYTGHWKMGLLWFVGTAAAWYSVMLTDEDYAWNSLYLMYGLSAFDAATSAIEFNRNARKRAGVAANAIPSPASVARISLITLTF